MIAPKLTSFKWKTQSEVSGLAQVFVHILDFPESNLWIWIGDASANLSNLSLALQYNNKNKNVGPQNKVIYYGVLTTVLVHGKVEKISKDSLDLIPSPSVKIQMIGGKVSLRCKGKTLLGIVNKLLKTKKFVDITQQCVV